MNFILNSGEKSELKPDLLLGEEIIFKIVNLPPNNEITLHLRWWNDENQFWYSQGLYQTDDQGEIDSSKTPSTSGNYHGIDPTGLFWSMYHILDIKKLPHNLTPLKQKKQEESYFYLDVEVDGKILSFVSIEILKKRPEVVRESVKEEGIVANFYYMKNKTNMPVVIVLGGSEGGMATPDIVAGILASYGYASMALAYFGLPGLPEILNEIPLDYVERTIEWVQKRDMVDKNKISMMGTSKGAELALLSSSMFPLSVVIAISPSSAVFQSLNSDPNVKPTSSWTYQGKNLPFTPFIYNKEFLDQFSQGMPKDMKFLPLYEESLKDNKAVKNAAIKVENIKGPILIVSSDEDKVWPSKKMCDNIKERLHQNNFSFKIEHVNYSQVGHMAGRPGYRPWPQPFYVKGGEPSFNGRAQADLWKRILKFLKENLY